MQSTGVRYSETGRACVGFALLLATVGGGCGDSTFEEEQPLGGAGIAAAEAMAVDSSAAIASCREGMERASVGEPFELENGVRLTVHGLETGLEREQLGSVHQLAVADLEVCAGSRRLNTPFTNRSAFSLCQSYVARAGDGSLERVVTWSSPDPMPALREPSLPSVMDDVEAGSCRRGWVAFTTWEGEPGWRLHGVGYDTTQFTDHAPDQARIAWTME
ncbi:MAG TPA: hypothetical protein VMS86_15885 [Thermoanaerobaculia bacterium]|nr:hypothetical protein [Thermoanaerobaculia bacterium]